MEKRSSIRRAISIRFATFFKIFQLGQVSGERSRFKNETTFFLQQTTTKGKMKKTTNKAKMQSEKPQRENEVLEMFSASKLVEDLMKRDGLTADLVAGQTGKPVQYIIEILEHVRDITREDALLFERRLGWSALELLDHQTSDVMAKYKAQMEILKIWSGLLKVAVETREFERQVKKFEALVEKICGASAIQATGSVLI
jgi:plasmid maintenance system antidote protein VapI